jgi:hypothetical protein
MGCIETKTTMPIGTSTKDLNPYLSFGSITRLLGENWLIILSICASLMIEISKTLTVLLKPLRLTTIVLLYSDTLEGKQLNLVNFAPTAIASFRRQTMVKFPQLWYQIAAVIVPKIQLPEGDLAQPKTLKQGVS